CFRTALPPARAGSSSPPSPSRRWPPSPASCAGCSAPRALVGQRRRDLASASARALGEARGARHEFSLACIILFGNEVMPMASLLDQTILRGADGVRWVVNTQPG